MERVGGFHHTPKFLDIVLRGYYYIYLLSFIFDLPDRFTRIQGLKLNVDSPVNSCYNLEHVGCGLKITVFIFSALLFLGVMDGVMCVYCLSGKCLLKVISLT